MKIQLQSDFEITDSASKEATGKTLEEWFAAIEEFGVAKGRREVITWLYDQTGRGKDVWWPTTVWVEYERKHGLVNKKDGLLEGYNICSTKTVTAPVTAVYRAWTQDAADWLGIGPAEEGAEFTDNDGNTGRWLRLRQDKDVRFEWKTAGVEHSTLVDAAFVEKAGKTGITVNHNRIQTRAEADGARKAWAGALSRLKAKLEA